MACKIGSDNPSFENDIETQNSLKGVERKYNTAAFYYAY